MPKQYAKKDRLPQLDRPLLIRLYHEQLQVSGVAVDKLPYTITLDNIVQRYNERHTREPAGHYEIYQTLVILRKNRKLVTMGSSNTHA